VLRLAPALAALALALAANGCSDEPPLLDGVYRATVSAKDLGAIDASGESGANLGTWTLVLNRGRFAVTQESDEACAWAYGVLALAKGNRMSWRVIDAGAVPAGAASNHPGDGYRFSWSRYRDVLTLRAPERGTAGFFAAKPWHRIARANGTATRCSLPAGALQPTGAERATPAPDATIDFTGDLSRTGPTGWEGSGTAKPLGRGRLRIEGDVVFSRDGTRSRLTFAAGFAAGELRGCAITTVILRPHDHYLWVGEGQITGTSPALRAYLGLAVGLGGTTRVDDLDHMHGGLAGSDATADTPGDRC
jgi:hypothetical protein